MEKTSVTRAQIQEEILSMPAEERASLLTWLIEVDKSAWDLEIEQDFAEGGAGGLLLDEIRKDFKAGHCRKWL
jgi:hypothetical protein